MNYLNNKLISVFAVAALVSISANALAQDRGQGRQSRQGGGMNMMTAGGMTPDYLLRDLQRFQEGLDLEEVQVAIVEQILREYDEAFREASESSQQTIGDTFRSMRGNDDDPLRQQTEELRSQMRELREKLNSARQLQNEDGMDQLTTKLQSQIEEMRDEMRQVRSDQMASPERQAAFEEIALIVNDQLKFKRQMREEFEGDLVAILTEGQLSLWPPLQRQLVRDRLLPRGRLSGETIDVMGLVEQQEFTDEVLTQILPVLSIWDENVTSALVARDDHMTENQSSVMSSMTRMDSSNSVNVLKEQARLAEAVRDINNSAVSDIALQLPEDEGNTFTKTAKERAYPRVYRPTRTHRTFKAAMELEDLEEDILEAIQDLFVSFEMEIEYANEQIYAATLRWESQEQLDRMNRWAQRMAGNSEERPESPIRKAEEDRRTIEENYIEQLKMLLTPEQIEALGGLENRDQRRENRGRGNWGGDWGNRDSRSSDNGGREAFMSRFDSNGDGTIDDSEREAIREHFRNGGSHDFGGGGSSGNTGSGNRQGGGNGSGGSSSGGGRPPR